MFVQNVSVQIKWNVFNLEMREKSERASFLFLNVVEFMIENEFTELSPSGFCDKIHFEI